MKWTSRAIVWVVVVCALCACWAGVAAAQTTIPGGNINNATWTAANSPYIIEGDITVPSGGLLTIEAGVELHFSGSDNLAAAPDTNRTALVVEGALDVNGTQSSPVRFIPDTGTTSMGSNARHWYGIVVESSATQADFDYIEVENASEGMVTSAADGVFQLNHASLRNNDDQAIHALAGEAVVKNARIYENPGVGVRARDTGELDIDDSLIYDNGGAGANINMTGGDSAVSTFGYTTINNNGGHGIDINADYQTNGVVGVQNSIITNNGGYGMYRDYTYGDAEMSYSNVWGNSSGDIRYVDTYSGYFSYNPLYKNAPGDLELTSNSPCRFAGNTGQDIGAVPYAGAPTGSLQGVIWSDTTLDANGSPYTIPGDLLVGDGVTLTIDPGVTLQFATTDQMGGGYVDNAVEFRIHGTLDAVGQPANSIVFEGPGSGSAEWYGMYMEPGLDGVTIRHAIVRNADFGINIEGGTSSNSVIEHSELTNNDTQAVRLTDGAPKLDGLHIHDNPRRGIAVGGAGELDLTNALIVNNGNDGVWLNHASNASANHTIMNSTIHGNSGHGVSIDADYQTSASIDVINTMVTSNGGYGIYRNYTYGDADTSYSNVWNNSSGGTRYVTSGSGMQSENPLYQNAPSDLRLTSFSGLIDAGTSSGAPSSDIDGNSRPVDGDGLNGAEYDIGAYEYGASTVCGDGTVGGNEACDDGADNGSYGHCNSTCSGPGPSCGDGTVQSAHEECDDGNDDNTDSCTNACEAATCGDGFVQEGVEECDDGNTQDGDGCSSTCVVESGGDAGPDAGADAGPDAGADAGPDAGADAGPDAGADAGADAGTGDAGADAGAGSDIGGDTSTGESDTSAEDGCGCSSTRGGPNPADGVYLVVVAFGLAVLRRR